MHGVGPRSPTIQIDNRLYILSITSGITNFNLNMTTPSNNNNNSTSYKPFAQSSYNNNEDEIYSRQLSAIDEEIIKRTTLLQLKEKLFNLPHNAKSSLVYAQQVTDIVNDDHLLGFLYVENYNVDVSV